MIRATRVYDYVLVGGGLQAGLLALAINHYKPDARVLLLEKNERLFGNHTWSFHLSDVSRESDWLKKLPVRQWPGYSVHFPGFDRTVDLPYCSTSSQQFESAIENLKNDGNSFAIKTSSAVTELGLNHVVVDGGERFEGDQVVDCRGKAPAQKNTGLGFQKFFGLEIELDEDWPDQLPVLMEANVDQSDGFRFLYVLPFTKRRVLVEDNY